MSCLQLDVGNSAAKWRLVVDGEVTRRGRFDCGDGAAPPALPVLSPAPAQVWVSSVAGQAVEEQLAHAVQAQWQVSAWFARTEARTADLCNSYSEPARMGVDRWLAMLGARAVCRSRLCVIDAGSALTIDLVAADGRHEGGYIIPGPALMERALLLDTDRVRFDEEAGYELGPGDSTAAAVRHGIALAQAGAVSLALAQAGDDTPELFFCGGGGEALLALAGKGGQLRTDLVFEGLEVMAQLR